VNTDLTGRDLLDSAFLYFQMHEAEKRPCNLPFKQITQSRLVRQPGNRPLHGQYPIGYIKAHLWSRITKYISSLRS